MSNMSYCQFENTVSDLMNCRDALDGSNLKDLIVDASEYERPCIKSLIDLCKEIAENYGEYKESDFEVKENHKDEIVNDQDNLVKKYGLGWEYLNIDNVTAMFELEHPAKELPTTIEEDLLDITLEKIIANPKIALESIEEYYSRYWGEVEKNKQLQEENKKWKDAYLQCNEDRMAK